MDANERAEHKAQARDGKAHKAQYGHRVSGKSVILLDRINRERVAKLPKDRAAA
jgi:hypothetical protein